MVDERAPVVGMTTPDAERALFQHRVENSVSETSPPSVFAEHGPVLGWSCVRETWGTASFRGENFRELMVKSVGKPDARKGHVRFDERGRETGGCQQAPHRALPRLYLGSPGTSGF